MTVWYILTSLVEVIPVNNIPVVTDFERSVIEDGNTEISLFGFDEDGDSLTFQVVITPNHGIYENGIYTPDPDYNGDDSFTYRAYDGFVQSEIGEVSLAIISVNDPPVVTDVTFDDVTDGYSFNLNANDVDEDDLTLSFVPVDATTFFGGSIADNGNDTFTYSIGNNSFCIWIINIKYNCIILA